MVKVIVSDTCEALTLSPEIKGEPLDICGAPGDYVATYGRGSLTYCELCTLTLIEDPSNRMHFFGPSEDADGIEWMMLRAARKRAARLNRSAA